jgi:hypothetical protein
LTGGSEAGAQSGEVASVPTDPPVKPEDDVVRVIGLATITAVAKKSVDGRPSAGHDDGEADGVTIEKAKARTGGCIAGLRRILLHCTAFRPI